MSLKEFIEAEDTSMYEKLWIRVHKEIKKKLQKIADREGVSLAVLIRAIIKKQLKEIEDAK